MTYSNDERLAALEQRVAELEANISTRDEFLTLMAHELRTPLAAIVGWIDLLRVGPATIGNITEAADAIERAAQVQARLLDDVVTGAKLATGGLSLQHQPVFLATTLSHAFDAVRPLAHAQDVQVTIEGAERCTVLGDPDRLQQALINIAAAAIRIAPRAGRVAVAMERDDVHVETRIDTFRGPEGAVGGRQRVPCEESLKDDLGLTVGRQLIDLHGGAFKLTSSEDGDCCFIVSLPLLPVGLEDPASRTAEPRPAECAGLRILVVDDDEDARSIVAEVLARHGALVDVADSSRAAIRTLARDKFDLLVSDVSMPVDDGFSLLEQLRHGDTCNRAVPAIALTAQASPGIRERTIAAGFSAYVTKPVSSAGLVSIVATVARSTLEQ